MALAGCCGSVGAVVTLDDTACGHQYSATRKTEEKKTKKNILKINQK
jgi:hypothetical protein